MDRTAKKGIFGLVGQTPGIGKNVQGDTGQGIKQKDMVMGQMESVKGINKKNIRTINSSWAIALFTLFVLIGCGENEKRSNPETPTVTMELEQDPPTADEVQRAVAAFNKAMVDPSVELMDGLCAEELTYGHSSGLIQNKAEFIDDLVNGAFDFLSLEAPDQTIHISGNTAIVRHIFLAKGTNAGEPVDVRIGNMQVYIKDKDNQLQLLARQAYKLPN